MVHGSDQWCPAYPNIVPCIAGPSLCSWGRGGEVEGGIAPQQQRRPPTAPPRPPVGSPLPRGVAQAPRDRHRCIPQPSPPHTTQTPAAPA